MADRSGKGIEPGQPATTALQPLVPDEPPPPASGTPPAPPPGRPPDRGQWATIRARVDAFGRRPPGLGRWNALPVAMVVVIGVIALLNRSNGVDWGDDFALYMRQAKALAIGNVGEVAADNRFAVDNSGWSTFSPYLYPWGWPLIVAPLYAVVGLDYAAVKVVEVAAFCVFLLCFFAIVRRRAGLLGATMLVLLIGLSPRFVGATDTVLSDIPFLAFVGLTLWWLDVCRERGILEAGRWRLVVLGLLLAYAWNIRREGISLLVAVLALHMVVIGGRARREGAWTASALRDVDWRAVALPYLSFSGAAVAFHLLLPTVLLPNAPGTGLSNIPDRLDFHTDVLAEQVGLKDPGSSPIQLLGNERAGRYALMALVFLAVVGVVVRLVTRLEEDIAPGAYLAAASFVMLVSPYQESRYLLTITPLLAYFAYQALPAIAELDPSAARGGWARLAAIPPVLAIGGLVLINAQDLKQSVDYHRAYRDPINGPETAQATEMFGTVKSLTRADDVILFFRARAMTLYTDRRAVQGSNLDLLLPRSDWYVMEKGSTYSQALLTDEEAAARGLGKAWENEGWVIWRAPPPTA